MRLSGPVETMAERQARLSEWHLWFAWCPVVTDAGVVWLETVWRRGVAWFGYEPLRWEYVRRPYRGGVL